MAAVMYLLMIFVWGFSWIAIKWQHGEVATEVSIFYRFAIASLLMFAIGFAFNKLQAVKLRQHIWTHPVCKTFDSDFEKSSLHPYIRPITEVFLWP